MLFHTDLQRKPAASLGTPLHRVNWGNYDLGLLDESHNFRNNDAFKDTEIRFQKQMNSAVIAQETIDGKTVFFVDQDALAACFDTGVTEELVKTLAARKPLRVVFRDAGFRGDDVKINVEQIFKLLSPATEVKAI